MKPTLLLGCALLAGTALHAQFSLLPHAGIEQSRNTLTYGNALSAQDINGFLKAGLRAGYGLKGGHSPFINLTTNPSAASFAFGKDGSLLSVHQATALQFRMEAGYQYSSKPIQLGKRSTPKQGYTATTERTIVQKKSCGSLSSTYRSSCGSKNKRTVAAPVNTALNMRLQPSVAFAYIPAAEQRVVSTAPGFEYTPAFKTAVVPAMGFEFAKGTQRLFTLAVFYTQPLVQQEQVVNTVIESKTIVHNLQSRMSSWGVTVGVPFSFARPGARTASKAPAANPATQKKSCGGGYYRRSLRI